MPAWERRRLLGAVVSDPTDEEPTVCGVYETDQPDDEDVGEGIPAGGDSAALIEHAPDPVETGQEISFDGLAPLPPLPPRPQDDEENRHDELDLFDGKKFAELPPRLMI